MFGYPSPYQLKKYQDSTWMSPVYLTRKYHGYFIYWAAIYTFWYHPMENTIGHAFGVAHTWFFMLQGEITQHATLLLLTSRNKFINSTIFSRMHCALLKLHYNTICLVYQTYIFVKIFHHDSEVLFFSNDDRDSSASGVINIANVVFCDTPEK